MKNLSIVLLFTLLPIFSSSVVAEPTNNTQQATEQGQMLVNLNSANEAQLLTLKGVGKSKAKAIISFRDEHGKFVAIEDLELVKGIGKQVVEDNKSRLAI